MKVIAEATATDLDPITVTERAAEAGIEVAVVNQSRCQQDGVVELVPPAGDTPAGWPARQHFHSLAPGESRTLKLVSPGKLVTPPAVRVRVGDRKMLEVKG